MSISTMMHLGLQRSQQNGAAPEGAVAADEDIKTSTDSYMQKIAAFIPSEIIGIYVAGLGIFSPDTDYAKWLLFGICIVLIPIIMWLDFLVQKKKEADKLSGKIKFVLLIFALVAYVAWTAAMPGTPFLSFNENATLFGGFAVIILAVVMYRAAEVLDIVPASK